jgi:hypothetical protein
MNFLSYLYYLLNILLKGFSELLAKIGLITKIGLLARIGLLAKVFVIRIGLLTKVYKSLVFL